MVKTVSTLYCNNSRSFVSSNRIASSHNVFYLEVVKLNEVIVITQDFSLNTSSFWPSKEASNKSQKNSNSLLHQMSEESRLKRFSKYTSFYMYNRDWDCSTYRKWLNKSFLSGKDGEGEVWIISKLQRERSWSKHSFVFQK